MPRVCLYVCTRWRLLDDLWEEVIYMTREGVRDIRPFTGSFVVDKKEEKLSRKKLRKYEKSIENMLQKEKRGIDK